MYRLRHLAVFVLLIVALAPDVAHGASKRQQAATTIQASVSDEGLALISAPGFAKVVSGPKSLRKIRVRRNEVIVAVEETSSGLVAVGTVRKDEHRRLVFLEAGRSGTRRLSGLQRTDDLRLRPVLLMEAGRLVGAAWLEGPDLRSLKVKTADWDGSRWGPIVTVSTASPGSQTGLTGTVLEDGSTLLVWSQFDGTDDELFFSWRRSGDFSIPQRISADNDYPDVAPSVTFSARGAVVSWSRFDGSEYSVWTAEFGRGEWRRERRTGKPGSLFPQYLHRRDGLFLISRSARPRGWSIQSASRTGRMSRRSFVASDSATRPVLGTVSGDTVTLEWPQQQRQSKARMEIVP
jgi:hypothetical protein